MRWAVPAAAAALALLPVVALAHASLVGANPSPDALLTAPPAQIDLRFSEPVTPAGPGITVISPSGRPAASGPTAADGTRLTTGFRYAGPGTYLVVWEVIAADTHPGRGQYTFSIGRTSTPPAGENLDADVGAVSPAGLVVQGFAHWLHFAGLALGFGVVAFRVLVLPAAGPAQDRRLNRLVTAGIVLLAVAEPVAVAGQALSLGVLAGDLLASSFGRAVGLRLGGSLVLWAGAGAVREAGRGRWALLALGAALTVVDGAAGHRIAGLPDPVAFALTAVHESAMAVWLGGLVGWLVTRAEMARFGRVAIVSFAVLAASGLGLAAGHLRTPLDLVASTYGLVLALKVLAVVAATVIAWAGARRLELAALAGVVALAGLLVSLPPPR